MQEPNIFEREQAIIERTASVLAEPEQDSAKVRRTLEQLLKSYEKLFRQTARLIRQSDRQQEELRRLHEINKEYTEKLEALTLTDGLTNIPNRRHFDGFLKNEWRRALRSGALLSVIMVDIDHFKLFNDHYGHGVGDECLRKVASALSMAVRNTPDLVARYGGEEFAAVLPETDTAGAASAAERMLGAVLELNIPHLCSPSCDCVSISLGIATTRPNPGSAPEELVKAADQELYRAKAGGRCRVCCIGDGVEAE